MTWLLDTCVISELVKPKPAASVVSWVDGHNEDDLFLSVLTLGELEAGIARLPESAMRRKLEAWVRTGLADRFRGRLLLIDAGVASRWGAIAGTAIAHGKPLPVIDALIAATSLQHGLTIVTRNTSDLERCGGRCVNPWVQT